MMDYRVFKRGAASLLFVPHPLKEKGIQESEVGKL
jgi:hypothetical protein|tara:strand:+ start:184 stop:288 length:105 start_codon:yes stop_codon:yes gene_type:complete